MKVFIWGLLVVAAVLGAATTAHYLELLPPGSRAPWGLLAVGFALTACFTLGNLLLRWMRWHFLTRRFALFFRTRESIKLYFATLPLLAVPAFLGELLRPWTISGRDPRARWVVLQVWFLERGMDVSVVALWWLIGLQVWSGVLAVALASWVVVSVILT